LFEQLQQESDDYVKASLLLSIGSLRSKQATLSLEPWQSQSEHPGVRTAAAIATLWTTQTQAPQSSIDILLETLRTPEPVNQIFNNILWSDDRDVIAMVSGALSWLGVEQTPFIVSHILDALDLLHERDFASTAIVGLILGLCFTPRKEPLALIDLSDFQHF